MLPPLKPATTSSITFFILTVFYPLPLVFLVLYFPLSSPSFSPSVHPSLIMDINSLISQTEALSWEDPSTQIESKPTNTPSQACFPLIALLISQKTNNNQSVQAALNKAWEFAVPFSFATIGPNKFLFKSSNQAHLDRIFK
jgi:hypothetical protein